MVNLALPPELLSSIGSETKDFVVEAERAKPLKVSFSAILYGAVWTGMGTMLLFIFVTQTSLMSGSNLKSSEGLVFTGLMIVVLSGVAKLFFEIYYKDSEHYSLYKSFLNNPEYMLKKLKIE